MMAEEENPTPSGNKAPSVKLVNGWDGKLRVPKSDLTGGANEPSPPPSDNEDAPEDAVEGEQIDADEGRSLEPYNDGNLTSYRSSGRSARR